jgi:hypothetical protein
MLHQETDRLTARKMEFENIQPQLRPPEGVCTPLCSFIFLQCEIFSRIRDEGERSK